MADSTPVAKPRRRRGAYLSETEKTAIQAERLTGRTAVDIAQRFNVNRATVARVCRTIYHAAQASALAWREQQASKAIRAVNAGLDAPRDPYKRAGIGVQALKGLGVYAPDTVQQTNVLVASMRDLPADWRDRYVMASSVSDASGVDPEAPPPLPVDLPKSART